VYRWRVGLFPSAPEVKIYAPAHWYAGELFAVEVEVIAKDKTRVDFVEARVLSEEGWRIKSGNNHTGITDKTYERVARLMEHGVLPAGSTTFSAQFGFPRALPPTHRIDPAWNVCVLRVHVSIPWWPDGRYRFPISVRHRITEPIVREPLVMRSTRTGARADKPRIELGLASKRLIAGETLAGSVALFHLDDDKPRELELALVPSLTLLGRGRPRDRRGEMLRRTIELPSGYAGKAHEFALEIPATITPSFTSRTHTLRWHLVAKTGSFFGPNVVLEVPLEIVDATAARSTPQLLAPPRVADARATALLSQLAQTAGWTETRGEDPERDGAQPAITREIGEAELRIAYSYRGEDGTFLVGRVDHPSLGLGLSVTPSSTLRHLFFEDVEVDIADWDRAHHVTARFAEQTIPFLRAAIGPALGAAALGQLVQWTDDALVYERSVSSLEATDLNAFATAIADVAAAIHQALSTITPPPGLTVDVAAWKELARSVRGTLSIGDLAIDGELDRMPVSLGLAWTADHRPGNLLVSVGHPDRASAAIREVTLVLAEPARQYIDVLQDALRDRISRWPADIIELHVVDGVASASLVGTVDATRVRALVHELRSLLASLDPAGPYR
jgi:hypothetical protein